MVCFGSAISVDQVLLMHLRDAACALLLVLFLMLSLFVHYTCF